MGQPGGPRRCQFGQQQAQQSLCRGVEFGGCGPRFGRWRIAGRRIAFHRDDELAAPAFGFGGQPLNGLAGGDCRNLFEHLGELAANDQQPVRAEPIGQVGQQFVDPMRGLVEDERRAAQTCCLRQHRQALPARLCPRRQESFEQDRSLPQPRG